MEGETPMPALAATTAKPGSELNEILRETALTRLVHYRREARRAAERFSEARRHLRSPARRHIHAAALELTGPWNGDLEILRDCIDMASDWGPHELLSIEETKAVDGTRNALCKFAYHGDEESAGHYEFMLIENLSRITVWRKTQGGAEAAND
jgi:hypothetical protein